ncbi:MAG: hypothetical protein R2831_11530 [Chitinophagaceae bacterium]
MKQFIFSLLLLCTAQLSFAQSEAYMTTMKGLLKKMSAATNVEAFQAAGNGFERVANAETKEWLPRYYAANCLIMQAFMLQDKSKVDPLIDAAENWLNEAKALSESEEITCLRSLCKSARIGVDPMTRGMKYGMESKELLEFAKKVNPNNPRIYFLEAQNIMYTPEQFGGGKAKAKPLFEKAVALYEKFTPENELMPIWGASEAKKMLEACSQ